MQVGSKEQFERGFIFEDKYVCAECIEEDFLSKYVKENGEIGRCSYCSKRGKVFHFDDIAEMVINGFNAEYEDPAEHVGYCSQDGGYLLPTQVTRDLLFNHSIGEKVSEDIAHVILQTDWVRQNPYSDEKHVELISDWESFIHHIKHETRYFFRKKIERDKYGLPIYSEPHQILDYIGEQVSELGLIKEFSIGSIIFRTRDTEPGKKYTTFKQLGAPPVKKAIANRMSPAGISMFYGALDKETCFKEIKQRGKRCTATTASWETKCPLTIFDLTCLSEIPSLFDEDNRWKRTPLRFLYGFREDFSKPIKKDGREHIEYVPTQVVTEYFRRIYGNEHEEIHGIFYPSSKSNGTSCVFFCGPEGCCSKRSKKDNSKILFLMPDSIEVRNK